MPRVEYSRENVEMCWCGSCPVQVKSDCAKDLYEKSKTADELPPPDRLGGLYCATGRSVCDDIDAIALCNCPACLVWGRHGLTSNHYCVQGSAEQTGR